MGRSGREVSGREFFSVNFPRKIQRMKNFKGGGSQGLGGRSKVASCFSP